MERTSQEVTRAMTGGLILVFMRKGSMPLFVSAPCPVRVLIQIPRLGILLSSIVTVYNRGREHMRGTLNRSATIYGEGLNRTEESSRSATEVFRGAHRSQTTEPCGMERRTDHLLSHSRRKTEHGKATEAACRIVTSPKQPNGYEMRSTHVLESFENVEWKAKACRGRLFLRRSDV